MLSQVRSVSSGYWIHFEFPMTLIRLIDYPLMGEGARNIYDPANDMPADYIVKAVGGNVHRNAVIVSDSPAYLACSPHPGAGIFRCATRCGLKPHGGISGLCRRIWTGFASATAGIWPCSLIPGKSL